MGRKPTTLGRIALVLALSIPAAAAPITPAAPTFERGVEQMEKLYREMDRVGAADLMVSLQRTRLQGLPPATTIRFLTCRARILFGRAQVTQAEQNLDGASELATDPLEKTRLALVRAREALKQLRWSDLERDLEAVGKELGSANHPAPDLVRECLVLKARLLASRGQSAQSWLLLSACQSLPGASDDPDLQVALAERASTQNKATAARQAIDRALGLWARGGNWEALTAALEEAGEGDGFERHRLVHPGADTTLWSLKAARQLMQPGRPALVRLWAAVWLAHLALDSGQTKLVPSQAEVLAIPHPLAAAIGDEIKASLAYRSKPEAALSLDEELLKQSLRRALPGDHALYRWLCPGRYARRIAAYQGDRQRSIQVIEQALRASPETDESQERQSLRSARVSLQLGSLDLEGAKATLHDALDDMKTCQIPSWRLWGLNDLFNGLLGGGRDPADFTFVPNPVVSRPEEPCYPLLRDSDSRLSETLSHEAQQYLLAQPSDSTGLLFEGLLSGVLGRTHEAQEAYEKALTTFNAGENPLLAAEAAKLLAWELRSQGRYDEADAKLRLSMSICRTSGMKDQELVYLVQRIVTMLLAKRYSDALELTHELARRKPTHNKYMSASLALFQAHCLRGLGREAEAAQSLRSNAEGFTDEASVEISLLRESARCEPNPARAAQDLGRAYQALDKSDLPAVLASLAGEYAQALEQTGQMALATEVCQTALKRCLEVRQRYPAEIRDAPSERMRLDGLLQRTVRLLLHQGHSAEALAWIESANRLELLPSIPSLPNRDAETTRLLQRLEEKRIRLGQLGPRSPEPSRSQALAEFQVALNELRSHNPQVDLLAPASVSEITQLQPRLPQDAAVVVLYPTDDEVVVQIATRESMQIAQVRLTASELLDYVRRWREALQNPQDAGVWAPHSLGSRLYDLLLSDVEPLLRGKSQLWVVPSGPFWYLPFDTLVDGTGHFLGERLAVSVLTSPDLRSLREPVQRPQGHAVVVANPTGDLPDAEQEGREVASILPDSILRLGPEASLAALLRDCGSARMLHFACHAELHTDALNSSRLRLAGGPANLKDIYGLQLQPGSLVVLSSCESGLGQNQPGKEVASLGSAFRAAGASSVVSTLWPIDDQATRSLMHEFYQALAAGAGRSQALALAKRRVASSNGFKHPFYWAAPFLTGDPR